MPRKIKTNCIFRGQVEYEYVVSMGCGENCPFVPAKNRIEWNIPEPKNMDRDELREVRRLIERHVKELIEKIKTLK
ncbi:MAG: hypothetical protein HZB80_11205 [Deltaproteobacteria bacterium]|nr:hypothetical protein [Deltaproteobacteria bacterium]